MFPFRVLGPSIVVAAASGVAVSVNGAPYVLVSNEGTSWADFAPCASTAGPSLPFTNAPNGSPPPAFTNTPIVHGALTPIAPGAQLLIATPGDVAFWGSLTGGVTVTPVEVGV